MLATMFPSANSAYACGQLKQEILRIHISSSDLSESSKALDYMFEGANAVVILTFPKWVSKDFLDNEDGKNVQSIEFESAKKVLNEDQLSAINEFFLDPIKKEEYQLFIGYFSNDSTIIFRSELGLRFLNIISTNYELSKSKNSRSNFSITPSC